MPLIALSLLLPLPVHSLFTGLRCALATASRLPGEPAERRAAPGGWPPWWRQLLEHTRDQGIVLAQRWYGSLPIAEFALLVGVKLTEVPPGIGTPQDVLAQYGLTGQE